MQESGAAGWVESRWTDSPVPTASALFEGEFAADPIKRPNRVRGFKESKT
jgi:hypothetical protein